MAKKIDVNKTSNGNEHVEKTMRLQGKKEPIDIEKYFGKVNFGTDGLDYQLKIRDEWK